MRKTNMLAMARERTVRLLYLFLAYMASGVMNSNAAVITVTEEKTVNVTGRNGNSTRHNSTGDKWNQHLTIDFGKCHFEGFIDVWSAYAHKSALSLHIDHSGLWKTPLEPGNEASGSYDIKMQGRLSCDSPVKSLEYFVTDWYGIRGWGTYKGTLDVAYTGGRTATADVIDQLDLKQGKGALSLIRRADPSVSLTILEGGRVSLRRTTDGIIRYVHIDPQSLLVSWDSTDWEAGEYFGTVTVVGAWR